MDEQINIHAYNTTRDHLPLLIAWHSAWRTTQYDTRETMNASTFAGTDSFDDVMDVIGGLGDYKVICTKLDCYLIGACGYYPIRHTAEKIDACGFLVSGNPLPNIGWKRSRSVVRHLESHNIRVATAFFRLKSALGGHNDSLHCDCLMYCSRKSLIV